jgi:hypothetical protein
VNATTTATTQPHFRFWIFDFRLSERKSNCIRDRSIIFLAQSKIQNCFTESPCLLSPAPFAESSRRSAWPS